MSFFCLLVAAGTGAAAPEQAPPAPLDKAAYWLWNPTPHALVREMNTDRPDKTESPYTVDAGHVQIEADVLNYSYDQWNSGRDHSRVEAVAIAPFNLKVGLCNSSDLQLVVPTYNSIRTHETRARSVHTDRGFGEIMTRLKYNVWGNDGGDTAFAAMPFVKWPTASGGLGNDSVEGGLILPLAVSLPAGWGMGTMFEVDFNRDEKSSGHHAEVITSLTFSHALVGELSGYVEFYNNVSTEQHGTPWVATADVGLTYALTPDIQLDCGINVGVTRAADDLNPFLGISVRF